jgi:hypothetical protein
MTRPLLAVLPMLAACAPALTTGVNTAPDLRSAAYRTFTWELPDQFPTGDPRLDNNPFFIRELQSAVTIELSRIGLSELQGPADLAVHFHATVLNRTDVYEADRRAGYDQPPGAPPQVVAFEEGTIVVDISERASKRLIWRGWMQTDLSGTIGNNEALGERVHRGMKALFSRFPAHVVARTAP